MRVWLISFISGLGGGVLSWFLADFVTRPIRRFRELRTEAKTLMILLWNAPKSGRYSAVEWLELMEAFKESRGRLDAVGAELYSFSQTERLASALIRLFGYKPGVAGRAAKRLAFELGTDIEDRDKNYQRLDASLKIYFDPANPFYDPLNPRH